MKKPPAPAPPPPPPRPPVTYTPESAAENSRALAKELAARQAATEQLAEEMRQRLVAVVQAQKAAVKTAQGRRSSSAPKRRARPQARPETRASRRPAARPRQPRLAARMRDAASQRARGRETWGDLPSFTDVPIALEADFPSFLDVPLDGALDEALDEAVIPSPHSDRPYIPERPAPALGFYEEGSESEGSSPEPHDDEGGPHSPADDGPYEFAEEGPASLADSLPEGFGFAFGPAVRPETPGGLPPARIQPRPPAGRPDALPVDLGTVDHFPSRPPGLHPNAPSSSSSEEPQPPSYLSEDDHRRIQVIVAENARRRPPSRGGESWAPLGQTAPQTYEETSPEMYDLEWQLHSELHRDEPAPASSSPDTLLAGPSGSAPRSASDPGILRSHSSTTEVQSQSSVSHHSDSLASETMDQFASRLARDPNVPASRDPRVQAALGAADPTTEVRVELARTRGALDEVVSHFHSELQRVVDGYADTHEELLEHRQLLATLAARPSGPGTDDRSREPADDHRGHEGHEGPGRDVLTEAEAVLQEQEPSATLNRLALGPHSPSGEPERLARLYFSPSGERDPRGRSRSPSVTERSSQSSFAEPFSEFTEQLAEKIERHEEVRSKLESSLFELRRMALEEKQKAKLRKLKRVPDELAQVRLTKLHLEAKQSELSRLYCEAKAFASRQRVCMAALSNSNSRSSTGFSSPQDDAERAMAEKEAEETSRLLDEALSVTVDEAVQRRLDEPEEAKARADQLKAEIEAAQRHLQRAVEQRRQRREAKEKHLQTVLLALRQKAADLERDSDEEERPQPSVAERVAAIEHSPTRDLPKHLPKRDSPTRDLPKRDLPTSEWISLGEESISLGDGGDGEEVFLGDSEEPESVHLSPSSGPSRAGSQSPASRASSSRGSPLTPPPPPVPTSRDLPRERPPPRRPTLEEERSPHEREPTSSESPVREPSSESTDSPGTPSAASGCDRTWEKEAGTSPLAGSPQVAVLRPQPVARPAILEEGRYDSDRSDSRSELEDAESAQGSEKGKEDRRPKEGEDPPRPPSPPPEIRDRRLVGAVVETILQDLVVEACGECATSAPRVDRSTAAAVAIFQALTADWTPDQLLPESRLELLADEDTAWHKVCFDLTNELLAKPEKWFSSPDRWKSRGAISPLAYFHHAEGKEKQLTWADVEAKFRELIAHGAAGMKRPQDGTTLIQMNEAKLESLLFEELENEPWGRCDTHMHAARAEIADSIFDSLTSELAEEMAERATEWRCSSEEGDVML